MNRLILDGDERDYLVWREGMGRTVEIFDICVGSERRKGKGTRLVEALLVELRKAPMGRGASMVYAITRLSNTVAHQFYESLQIQEGDTTLEFRILGRLHRFYRDSAGKGESALMYGMDI